MSIEERELLLKDLCSRLPYYVKLWSPIADGNWAILTPVVISNLMNADLSLEQVKPYLRPMSSMTRTEALDMYTTMYGEQDCLSVDEIDNKRVRYLVIHKNVGYNHVVLFFNEIYSLKQIDWLNEHNFDYRCLIEKGLALEATKGDY